jgi:hypothetical protein
MSNRPFFDDRTLTRQFVGTVRSTRICPGVRFIIAVAVLAAIALFWRWVEVGL